MTPRSARARALTAADRDSYDYAGSCDFTQAPIAAAFQPTVATIIPAEQRQLAQDPWREDDDPT